MVAVKTKLMCLGFPLGGGSFGGKTLTYLGYIFFVYFVFLLNVRGSEYFDISGLNAKSLSLCEYPNI